MVVKRECAKKNMKTETEIFCCAVRQRSSENREAMQCISHRNVLSPIMSILRQELDSLVRLIWLLSIVDDVERNRLIHATLSGEKWTTITPSGKMRKVTDGEMVDLAQRLHGWTKSVYKFGCAFIHLSDFHNHAVEDPFRKLPDCEKKDIIHHMRAYHGGPSGNDPDMAELTRYFPQVFDKIASNLDCYVTSLSEGRMIE